MSDKQTWLYVMASGKHRKVGISSNPSTRLKTIQTGSPFPVYIEDLFGPFSDRKSALGAEARAHDNLSSERLQGEWFDADKSTVNDSCVWAWQEYLLDVLNDRLEQGVTDFRCEAMTDEQHRRVIYHMGLNAGHRDHREIAELLELMARNLDGLALWQMAERLNWDPEDNYSTFRSLLSDLFWHPQLDLRFEEGILKFPHPVDVAPSWWAGQNSPVEAAAE